ncbi:hypothetical protein [Cyanobacterium aponinum]|uniref:hypothetical protein n=1 Tax=Cyanobacterium aponinum TaxID=379064 RepID=UPI000C12A3AC|nr:hypothetical protein [Cyanobacterium aponinum]PHV61072.1 hypothetical protein CSQ80_17585 [Cyanobacterium aponinum IPPAS B-1201]
MNFKKIFIEGDRTILNDGTFVQLFDIYHDHALGVIMDLKTEEIVSDDVRVITAKDLIFDGSYRGIKTRVKVVD